MLFRLKEISGGPDSRPLAIKDMRDVEFKLTLVYHGRKWFYQDQQYNDRMHFRVMVGDSRSPYLVTQRGFKGFDFILFSTGWIARILYIYIYLLLSVSWQRAYHERNLK